jgi:DNA-directed RNA polymerase subunit RPC12/RpoP
MPQEGDTKVKHCEKCQRETTWFYFDSLFGKDIWKCQDCGSRYYE